MKTERTPTPFESRVYEMIRQIPRGKVATYAEVARALGLRAPRAVGQALRRNPFAPHVPCHRVIASSLAIGGFAGTLEGTEIDRKRELLRQEGVEFGSDGRLADHRCVFRFSAVSGFAEAGPASARPTTKPSQPRGRVQIAGSPR